MHLPSSFPLCRLKDLREVSARQRLRLVAEDADLVFSAQGAGSGQPTIKQSRAGAWNSCETAGEETRGEIQQSQHGLALRGPPSGHLETNTKALNRRTAVRL